MRRPMRASSAWLLSALLVVLATLGLAARSDRPARPAGDRGALTADDLRWLNRVTFGINTDTVSRYRSVGRSKFLDEQLHPAPGTPRTWRPISQ